MRTFWCRLLILRARVRVTCLREEAEYHRSLAISLADQADRLERDATLANLELTTTGVHS